MYSFGYTDCIIKEMFWVKVNTFLERMLLVDRTRLDAVDPVGGLLAN